MDQQMGDTQIDSTALNSVFAKLESTKPKEEPLQNMFDNMQISVVGRENGADNNSDFVSSGNESDGDLDDEDNYKEEDLNKISQKHHKHTDLEERHKDDMDFPDEVDTPFKEARKRYVKYRGIKSLRNCDWDPYENLPAEYSKIWRFQNLQAEVK
jgi:pre-rRNA-processing protein TSR1